MLETVMIVTRSRIVYRSHIRIVILELVLTPSLPKCPERMINHLTGGPPDTQSLTLGVGLGRFHVTLRIHSVAVLWLSGTRELPRTLPKTHDA